MGTRRSSNSTDYTWERQENESAEAYEAFSLYRNLKPTERSLAKVGRQLGKSKNLMERWSSKYEWVSRCRDYDRYIDAEALEKATTNLSKMRAKHIVLGQMLQEKGLEALKEMPIGTLISDPATLLRFLTEGARIEEKNRADEQAAHKPTERDSAEDEALEKLDDILGRIKSGF